MPSSPVGHASIYLGIRGPVLATADLGVTGEAAFALACELIESGEAPAMLAGSVEERNVITDRVLGPVCSGSAGWRGARTEGSSVVVLEEESHATARGAKALCRVAHVSSGRGASARPLASLPAPTGERPLVIVPREDDATARALASSPWSNVDRVEVASRAGNHEGLGGLCVAVAASAIADGRATEALVFGLAPDRWAAIILMAL